MKKLKVYIALSFMLFASQVLFAINASDVATIDLTLALCLHPKMSLFDFERIGFYKVELGFTEEEFEARIEELRTSAPDRTEELKVLEKELDALYEERETFSEYYVNTTEEKLKKLEQLRLASKAREKELNDKILEIEYQAENNDLTTPKETLVIIEQIEKDIFEAINQVVEEEKFSLVLNTTVPYPDIYKKNYNSGEIYGHGIPGINFMLFYSFLAMNNLDSPIDEVPPSRDLINWLELTRDPKTVILLPMKHYPLVLSGGKSILSSVVKKVYNKYKIKPAVYNVVDSVILKIEELQNGSAIEQKIIKNDF